MAKKTNLLFIVLSLGILLAISLLYLSPVLTGKSVIQPDIVHYKGGASELLDYRASHGQETYWSDAMFGGMPTYQSGAQFRGDLIKQVDYALQILPRPANYIFLLMAGFFLLGYVVTKSWKYALLGATFFGLSTYFYIIIAAGHNGKVHTLAYFAPLLAGILLVYIRKKYLLGFVLTTLFMGLQIAANHPQMTYYLFIALGFLFLSELYRAIKDKTRLRHFLVSSGILALAFVLGVGMNSQRLLANAEFVKETTRGKQILDNPTQSSTKSGLDKESITMWSYGKLETLNLFIPRLMGGASSEEGSDKIMEGFQTLVQENVQSQAQWDRISQGLRSLTYWGEQPGTSGPAYQGAVVVFLAILGFFFVRKKYRYWILGASILTILLAWGHNFSLLTDFFIEYIPLYNKFRAPSSILVVVELLLPLVAILGLYQFFQSSEISKEKKQKTLIRVSAAVGLFLVLLLLGGKSLLGFYTPSEKTYLPPYLLDYLAENRHSVFVQDTLKTLGYVALVFALLFLSLRQKLSQNVVLIAIGLLSLVDLWSVNKRYLNDTNFVEKAFAEQPFLTEDSEFLQEKAKDNSYIQGLLGQIPVNRALEELTTTDTSHYRIYNQTLGTFGETNTSYFKSSIGGYSAAKLRRYDDLIDRYFLRGDSVQTPKVLNLLNAKYLIYGSTADPQVALNPDANGPGWLVSEVLFTKTANEEFEAIGQVDSKKVAVINAADQSYLEGKPLAADSTASFTLTDYKANEIAFASKSKTPQLAVISEMYYPYGWKAYVDQKPAEYIKVNYLLRGIYLPEGSHEVKMVFQPEVIQKGKLYSLLSTGLFVLLAGLGFYIERKKKPIKPTNKEVKELEGA
ncbi:YfhO family protein [Chryseobacterium sp. A301]